MSIANLIEPITGKLGPVQLNNIDQWKQGRTMYGGASALMAYTAAIRAFPDLPPLRSAQIGFVAPVGDNLELSAQIIRQGRNVTQIRSEVFSDGQLALTAFWLFGSDREPNAVRPANPLVDWPGGPEENAEAMKGAAPSFIADNFDIRFGQSKDGDHGATIRRWARLKEHHLLDPISKLVLMGDVMPPGALRIAKRLGPISSINWSFNVLDTQSQSEDGWYLAETSSQHADAGYSSEKLRMWATDGRQVLDGHQCVAVFG